MAETTTADLQAPSRTTATTAAPDALSSTTTSDFIANLTDATDASRFLKPSSTRKRRRSPDTSNPSITGTTLRKSPSPVSPKAVAPSVIGTSYMTAAAEMEQKRRKIEREKDKAPETSPNPRLKALGALLGVDSNNMSKPEDAPASSAPNTLSAAVAAIAPAISIPTQGPGEASVQTSPVSLTSSIGTAESTGITAISANGPRIASPGQMHDEERAKNGMQQLRPVDQQTEESLSNKAFSYPGPLINAQLSDARRGMSLPGSGLQRDNSKSPSSSNKKHKCPYCSTEFTRHHNLKSHLLTHSHEKPYLCQTCDSRFRRLHDLKRHTKLHTGERPHICPKCKRSFARGDALARHNKGQGGCAGRRSSVGSFGGDGPQTGDDGMEGMVYTNEASHEPDAMDEDGEGLEERGGTLPSIRRHDAPPDQPYRSDTQASYQRVPSTYPPVANRPPLGSGLYPPPSASRGGSSTSTSPGTQTSHPTLPPPAAFAAASVFAPPPAMTESPKPLSPGQPHPSSAGDPRNRSPSLSSQLAPNAYGRRGHSRSSPPPLHAPPPHSNAPQLPSLPGLSHPDPRFLPPNSGPGAGAGPHRGPMSHSQQGSYPPPIGSGSSHAPVPSSASNSLSSHGTAAHGSGDRNALPFPPEDRLWAVIRGLETKVDRLEAEVSNLRSQLAQQGLPAGQAR